MGVIRQSKSEQERAADRVAHEMDFLWVKFRREAEAVAANAIEIAQHQNDTGEQQWRNPMESMREVQKAFVMRCFAMFDGLSQYVRGGTAWDKAYRARTNKIRARKKSLGKPVPSYPSAQTYRMTRFIQHYIGKGPTAARLAIEIYRHMLMHEGALRGVIDDEERIYNWYLGWNVGADLHFSVRRSISGHTARETDALVKKYGNDYMGKGWLVELGTLNLIADVERAAARYVADLRADSSLYKAYERLSDERWEGKLNWTPRL
jgi:hypothetical protein